MTWQLWVLVGTAAVGVVVLVTARFRSAQQVLDELIHSVEPHTGAQPEQPATIEHRPEVAARRVDELARHRSRHHLRTTFVPRTAHSHRSRH
jgi:low affinity Fe/Cu permease